MRNAAKTLRVLVVEDDEFDAEIIFRALRSSNHLEYVIDQVKTLSAAFKSVFQQTYDIILLDLGLPDGIELGGLGRLVTMMDIPIIVLTGNDDPDLAEQALACGAHDYVPKSENLAVVLHRTVQFAIQRHHTQMALARTEEMLSVQNEFTRLQAGKLRDKLDAASRLATFVEQTDQCIAILTADGHIEWANPAFIDGCDPEFKSMRNVSLSECLSLPGDELWLDKIYGAMVDGQSCKFCWTVDQGDGNVLWLRVELKQIPQQSVGSQRFFLSYVCEKVSAGTDLPGEPKIQRHRLADTTVV
jgi:DNA-binding response OmpR family regulator